MHKQTSSGLAHVVARLDELVPEVKVASTAAGDLAQRVATQEEALSRTAAAVGSVAEVVPLVGSLAGSAQAVLEQAALSNERVQRMLDHLPRQSQLVDEVERALMRIELLTESVQKLREDVGQQSGVIQRMDGTLYNMEKDALRQALSAVVDLPKE